LYGTAVLTVVPHLGNKFAQNITSTIYFCVDNKFIQNPSVSHIDRGTQAESVREKGAEEILGIKSDEVTGDWRKLRLEEFHDLFCSPVILVIRSRRLRRNIYLEFGTET
jgi:hypothetical protein